ARRTRAEALQSNAFATVEEHLRLGGNHWGSAARNRAPTHRGAREHRLEVPVSQPPGRMEVIVRQLGRSLDEGRVQRSRISIRLFAAAALFHSPAVSSAEGGG